MQGQVYKSIIGYKLNDLFRELKNYESCNKEPITLTDNNLNLQISKSDETYHIEISLKQGA